MKKFVEKIKKICEENNKVGMFIDMDGTINEYTLYSDATILKQMSDNYSSTEPILSVIETLEDRFENMGAQLVKQVATKTNDVAGDGTTTATVLAQAMVHEGMKNLAAGANPIVLRKGMKKATDKAVQILAEMSQPVAGKEQIAKVAAVSSGSEEVRQR